MTTLALPFSAADHKLPYARIYAATFLIFLLLLAANTLNAQTKLWGLVTSGPDDLETGGVFNLGANGSDYNFYPLPAISGSSPGRTGLLKASNGKFYGVTEEGGTNDSGVLFEYNPATGAYVTLRHFEEEGDGAYPVGRLIEVGGAVYGVTPYGGNEGGGTLYRYDFSGGGFSVLYHFNDADGGNPKGGLHYSSGVFYGLTQQGGDYGSGVLFRYDPAGGGTYTALYHFDYDNVGGYPDSYLVEKDGVMYGTVEDDGQFYSGILFKYDPAGGGMFTVLHQFDYTDPANGGNPLGSLVEKDGIFYGTANSGGAFDEGIIFAYDPTNDTYSIVHDFDGDNGRNIQGTPIVVGDNLYGMASSGGTENDGVLFEFDPSTNAYTILHSFELYTSGRSPYGSIMESNGKLYGMTSDGPGFGSGLMFEYDPAVGGGSFVVLFGFDTAPMGRQPNGSLIEKGGSFYGLAQQGGVYGNGTLFKFDPIGNNFSVIHQFQSNDPDNGGYPRENLIEIGGKFYGLAGSGGLNDNGVLFEYDFAGSGTYTVKHHFNEPEGSNPTEGVVEMGGKLYGVTYYGGDNGGGVLFEYDPVGSAYTVLHHFSIHSNPEGGLLVYGGKLYGMTAYGGPSYDGVLFEYDPAGPAFNELFQFDDANGNEPGGNLLEKDGMFYGMTRGGGANYNGVLFKYDPTGDAYTILHDFNDPEGSYPQGGLIEVDGKFYGTTSSGGNDYYGVVFEYDPAGAGNYTVLKHFEYAGGGNPYGNLLAVTATACTPTLPAGTVYRWTNGGGDGLWSNPNNWLDPADNPGVPGLGHVAFFSCLGNSNASLDVSASVAKVIVDASYTGALSLGSQTLTLTQELSVPLAGRLNAGTSTVKFNGSVSANTAAALYNLELLGGGNIAPMQHIQVNNTLRITSVNAIGNCSSGNIKVKGHVINNDANGWVAGGCSAWAYVVLDGAGSQELSGTGQWSKLDIGKTSGVALMNDNLTLTANATLKGLATGALQNNPGRLRTAGNAAFDYAGTVDDVEFTGNGTITLTQNLNVADSLILTSVNKLGNCSSGNIYVKGALISNDANGWNAGSCSSLATVVLNGNANQTVSGTGLINRLEVAKTGGNVLMPDNLDLQHTGKLSGSGFFDNTGGVFNTKGNAIFDFSGTIEDLRCTTNGGSRTITLNQDLQVVNSLTLAGAGAGFRMTASPAGKKLKVTGNVSTEVFSWNTSTNAFISLTGSTDQTITTVGSGSLFKLDVNKTGGNVLMPADIWLFTNGELTGAGFFDNTGGVLRTLSGATFNFSGSIDDLRLAANNAIVTLKQDLQVNNSLTIDATPSGSFTLNANPAGKVLKVNGNVTTSATNWSTGTSNNAYISLRGSADQTLSGTGKIHRFDFAKPAGNALFSTASVKTFSGAATATAGNWDLLGNTFISSTGGFTASGSGKLTGAGTLTGSVTVASGGDIAPGSPVGCMTITGDLTFMGGAKYTVTVNGASTACTDFDQLNVSGMVAYAGTLQADFGYTPLVGATFLIANVAGGKSGSFAAPVVMPNNIACSFAPATGILTVTSVSAQGPAETRAGDDISAEPETNIADETAGLQLHLYPNPASELVNIEMTGTELQTADLLLYDQTGRLAYHRTFDGATEQTARINLREAGLKYGVYTVVLRMGDQVVAKRLVFMGQD